MKLGDKFGFQKCIDDYDKLKKLNNTKLSLSHPYVLGFIQNENDVALFFKGVPTSYQCTEVNFDGLKLLGRWLLSTPIKYGK